MYASSHTTTAINHLGVQDGSRAIYGMVEEFLELSRRLSVQTIRDFVSAVHKRIPSMFLEQLSCTIHVVSFVMK